MITRGKACCKYEPRGEHGLEGFNLGKEYEFQHVEEAEDSSFTKGFFRVFHDNKSTYYESTGYNNFHLHFKILNWHKGDLDRVVESITNELKACVRLNFLQDKTNSAATNKHIREEIKKYKDRYNCCPIPSIILLKEIKKYLKTLKF